jgi:hypothetical protein
MTEPSFARICQPNRRRRELVARAFALTAVAASGSALVTYAALREPQVVAAREPPTPLVVAIRLVAQSAPAVPSAPPVAPAPPTTPPPTPTDAALGCPSLADDPPPIGAALPRATQPEQDASAQPLTIIAAARAARLAVRTADGHVLISDDDGATFRAAFVDHAVDEIRFDRDGVLYARAGATLGVRDEHEHWIDVTVAACPNETCRDHIATVDDRVVWIHDGHIATSSNRGKSWRQTPDDQTWSSDDGALFAWHGALYQAEHYSDMCGIDDSPTWRFDPATYRVTNTIFHHSGDPGEPTLEPDDDAGSSWHWQERCHDESRSGSCGSRNATLALLLKAATLRPVEGARTLAVYDRALVEVCSNGARQVYRTFPFDHVDAVDSHGRPLVASAGAVLRWSSRDGWRRLVRP